MNYKKVLKQAVDLHVHIGPEIIPRKFNLQELLDYEKGKLKGVGVKNHFFPIISTSGAKAKKLPIVINSVVLNRYIGGFNSKIIYALAEISDRPIIVWFPTLHAEKFLKIQKNEIPQEWIKPECKDKIKLRPVNKIKPLSVFNSKGSLSEDVKKVLIAIKKCDAILATGHISWQESKALVKFAVGKIGIKKIIITHPIYQKIDMPVDVQQEMAEMGAFIEQCYSMYSIDKITIAKIASQIKKIGAENCILSSDVGQAFSKSPSESLGDFTVLLEKEGITEQEIKIMLIDNPNKLIR